MAPPREDASWRSAEHLDEMTCLFYIERQLERARALEVSAHAESCSMCRTLLRAIERESRLLTRAMLEEDEPFPARLAAFRRSAPCSGSGRSCSAWRRPESMPCTPDTSSRGNRTWNKPASVAQTY